MNAQKTKVTKAEEFKNNLEIAIDKISKNRGNIRKVVKYYAKFSQDEVLAYDLLMRRKDLDSIGNFDLYFFSKAIFDVVNKNSVNPYIWINTDVVKKFEKRLPKPKKEIVSKSRSDSFLNSEIFNEEFKTKFIENYSGTTKIYILNIFKRSGEVERKLNKDIYSFTRKEIEDLIRTYPNGSVQYVMGLICILRRYLDFAIENKVLKNNILIDVVGYNSAEQFTNKNRIKKILTEKDLMEVAETCDNPQDAISFIFPFYGIRGEKNSEIVNMKVEDIDFSKNTISIKGENKRQVKLADWIMDVLKKTIEQTVYEKIGGTTNIIPYFLIEKNDYVIRGARQKDNTPVNNVSIITRLKKISNQIGDVNFTPLVISRCGMYHYWKQIDKNSENRFAEERKLFKWYGISKAQFSKARRKMKEYAEIEDNLTKM